VFIYNLIFILFNHLIIFILNLKIYYFNNYKTKFKYNNTKINLYIGTFIINSSIDNNINFNI